MLQIEGNTLVDHQDVALQALEAELREAIRLQQFRLYYQPQVRIANREVIGLEALIHWAHPKRGLLPPAAFIPVAERSGLNAPIAEWVLRTACMQNKAWQDIGLPRLTVAVNLSALRFRQAGFVRLVAKILGETRLDPRFLDLDVTNSLAAGTPEALRAQFRELRKLGVALSIDDFGSGYSRFSQFVNLPPGQLRINRAIVKALPDNADAATIARSIVSMGSSLGVRVLAVGVEHRSQAEFLESICCQYAQGFLYSKPLPTDVFWSWASDSIAGAAAARQKENRAIMSTA